MEALTDTALLGIWERGCSCGPIQRALLLLGAALPKLGAEDRAELSIGERDAAILRLRQETFGMQLPGHVDCPACGERLEFELDVGHLPPGSPVPAERALILAEGLRFRLPNSHDLLAVTRCNDAEAAAQMLLQRCCLDAAGAQEWPRTLLANVETQMAAIGQAADILLHFDCVACGHAWIDGLDVAAYVWGEVTHRAQCLLDDVHRIAWSYGWDEQRILAMSSTRRAAYLERCDA